MKWLVTGGVGFIGYHVCSALRDAGHEITIVDDFSDAPYPRAEKERNQRDLGLRVVRACVTDAAATAPLVDGVNGVLHLAGIAGVRPSFEAPAQYASVNAAGTATMLAAAQRVGARFLYASSSSVYGNGTPLPANEDAAAVTPESPYAATKRAAELVALTMAKTTPELPITGLRFFTVYGPRQRPEMAITKFMRAIHAGRPITVFGDGSMRRDFTHVSDIVRGVCAAMERAPKGHRIYNLGSGRPITLNDLITAMERVIGKRAQIERAPVPMGDVDATYADIARAHAELGYSPSVSLEDGLRSVFEWISA